MISIYAHMDNNLNDCEEPWDSSMLWNACPEAGVSPARQCPHSVLHPRFVLPARGAVAGPPAASESLEWGMLIFFHVSGSAPNKLGLQLMFAKATVPAGTSGDSSRHWLFIRLSVSLSLSLHNHYKIFTMRYYERLLIHVDCFFHLKFLKISLCY